MIELETTTIACAPYYVSKYVFRSMCFETHDKDLSCSHYISMAATGVNKVLNKITRFAIRVLSAIAGTAIFVFMLPLTLGMMMLMVLFSIVTKATPGSRLHKSPVHVSRQKKTRPSAPTADAPQKPPIEGSYTVIDK